MNPARNHGHRGNRRRQRERHHTSQDTQDHRLGPPRRHDVARKTGREGPPDKVQLSTPFEHVIPPAARILRPQRRLPPRSHRTFNTGRG